MGVLTSSDTTWDLGGSISMTAGILSIHHLKDNHTPVLVADNSMVQAPHTTPLCPGKSPPLFVPSLAEPQLSITGLCEAGSAGVFNKSSFNLYFSVSLHKISCWSMTNANGPGPHSSLPTCFILCDINQNDLHTCHDTHWIPKNHDGIKQPRTYWKDQETPASNDAPATLPGSTGGQAQLVPKYFFASHPPPHFLPMVYRQGGKCCWLEHLFRPGLPTQ